MDFFDESDSIRTHVKPEMAITVLVDAGKALAIYQEIYQENETSEEN